MDIEKMMQEAQDINANQIPKDMREFIKVPSPYDTIMPDAVTPQANDIADIMNTSDQTEQNKFINILPVEEPEEKEIRKEDIKPTVTFDSVFNSAFSTPVINESKQEPENTQSIVNPSNEIPPLATELSTQFVPENNTPVIPEVPEITAENSDFIPTFTSPLDEIEHEVSSASPVMETIPYAKNGFEEMPEKVDISSATSIPDLSPVLENKIEDVIQPSVQESVKTEIPSITIDEPAGGEEIPEFTSTIAESAPNFTPNFENPIEVPSLTQSEIDFKPVNEINAVDIKEVVPEVMNNSVTQDNLESNSMSEIKNIEYALNIIKSCSEQLKKEGFEININELDLGMIYQVSITINKN